MPSDFGSSHSDKNVSCTTNSINSPLSKSNQTVKSYNAISQPLKSSTIHIGQSSLNKVLWNMLNALIGGGIVGIGYIYKSSGLIGGVLLMMIFAILCTYTLTLMILSAQKSNVHDYEKLCEHCFGINGYIIVCISLFLVDYGVMLTYLIILSDSSYYIAAIWGYQTLFDRNIVLLSIAIFIILPTCMYRDISALEKLSILKLFIVILVVLVVVYEYILFKISDNDDTDTAAVDYKYFNLNGIPEAIGIIGYAFVCHDSAFLYYNTLIQATIIRWSRVCFLAVFLSMLLSSVCGVFSYLTFGNKIQSNMLNNYPINNSLIILIRIIYVIIMSWSYPTAFYMVRHIILSLIQKLSSYQTQTYTVHSLPLILHISLTIFIFTTNLALAMYVDNVGPVMSIIGNIPSMNIAFIMPCLCYLKLHKHLFKFWKQTTFKKQFISFINVTASCILPIMGICIGIYGTIRTISE